MARESFKHSYFPCWSLASPAGKRTSDSSPPTKDESGLYKFHLVCVTTLLPMLQTFLSAAIKVYWTNLWTCSDQQEMPPVGAGGWHVLVFGPSLGQMGVVIILISLKLQILLHLQWFSHQTGFNNSWLLAAAQTAACLQLPSPDNLTPKVYCRQSHSPRYMSCPCQFTKSLLGFGIAHAPKMTLPVLAWWEGGKLLHSSPGECFATPRKC